MMLNDEPRFRRNDFVLRKVYAVRLFLQLRLSDHGSVNNTVERVSKMVIPSASTRQVYSWLTEFRESGCQDFDDDKRGDYVHEWLLGNEELADIAKK